MDSLTEKRGLNRTQLKYMAMLAMLIDHIGMFFIPIATPVGALCRIIGRLTAPVMCFFLAEGYRYTSSKKKYALRLLIFALISQPAYAFSHYNRLWVADFSMLFTLLLSFLVLLSYDKIKKTPLRWIAVVALTALSYWCDWGIFAPLWVLCFFVFRNSRKKQLLSYSFIAAFVCISAVLFCILNGFPWYGEVWQAGLFLFIPIFSLYNGQSGNKNAFHKWIFYVFYPLHLLILGLIYYYL